MKNKCITLLKKLWASCSHNLSYKVLSVVIALFLWSYVVYSNPDITRSKTISGVDITVSGQSVLSSRGLALLNDLNNELTTARVQIQVSQTSFSLANSDNVRVELDLSSIRKTGRQSIKLVGTSSYGRVTSVWPEYIELDVENQDQRYVPVNAFLDGALLDDHWYNISRVNPSQISVIGPTSIVQQVSSAQVIIDASGATSSQTRVAQLSLLDAQGNEIAHPLTRSASSVTVGVDIYPSKLLPILTDIDEVLEGQPRTGYVVTDVEFNPASIVVAGEQTLLDSLEMLTVVPVNISNADRTFTTAVQVSKLKDIRYISSEEVSVTVTIEEQPLTREFSGLRATVCNLGEGLNIDWTSPLLTAQVVGPHSLVEDLEAASLSFVVDLDGLGPGSYDLPITVVPHANLDISIDPSTVHVTIVK